MNLVIISLTKEEAEKYLIYLQDGLDNNEILKIKNHIHKQLSFQVDNEKIIKTKEGEIINQDGTTVYPLGYEN